MKIVLKKMDVLCKKSTEKFPFSPQITYFYGEMATGKTTIVRLINFCLGGNFKNIPPTIMEELISVQLLAEINGKDILFEREIKDSKQIKISWIGDNGEPTGVLAPIVPSDWPILGEYIFNVSDLLYHLFGQIPLKVPLGDRVVRLGFRDLMWYCNLRQEELASNFYNLGEDRNYQKMMKSRIAMRFILGLFDEKLYEIEKALSDVSIDRQKIEQDIQSVGAFLGKFGYESEEQLKKEIEAASANLKTKAETLKKMHDGYKNDTHFVDALRKELKELEEKINRFENAQADIKYSIEEKLSLKAELISSKAKLTRSIFAKEILEGAKFEFCPACGLQIDRENTASDSCILCGQSFSLPKGPLQVNQVMQLDLADRIKALEESVNRHQIQYDKQKKALNELRSTKRMKDAKLEEALREYDSRFLAQSIELEREVASSEEKVNYLTKISAMPIEIKNLKVRLTKLKAKEKSLKAERTAEMSKRQFAEALIKEIETSYRQALLAIKLPNIKSDDIVKINRVTWIPEIIPADKTRGKWSFFNVGSSGMEALLNVCYALVIHKTAAKNNLPLPTLLIIDSPAQYVDKDIDKTVFDSFYTYLYELSRNELSSTQFILIDNYYAAAPDGIQVIKRKMTRNDPNNPPLISYLLRP
jgi:hypothetical protein